MFKTWGRGALYVEMDLKRTFLVDRMKKRKQSLKFSDETFRFLLIQTLEF